MDLEAWENSIKNQPTVITDRPHSARTQQISYDVARLRVQHARAPGARLKIGKIRHSKTSQITGRSEGLMPEQY